MIDFINESLAESDIDIINMLEITIDSKIFLNHINNFNNELIENLKAYYILKNKQHNLKYSFFKTTDKLAPVVCKLNYSDWEYCIEIINTNNDNVVIIGIDSFNVLSDLKFISNYKKEFTSIEGGIKLISNLSNNGISISLLNIIYTFIEDSIFNEEIIYEEVKLN